MANNYYHHKYPNTIIFYKLKDGYTAFGEDAEKVCRVLNSRPNVYRSSLLPMCAIQYEQYLETVDLLNDCGLHCRSVVYRDSCGDLSVPCAEFLSMEQEIDY